MLPNHPMSYWRNSRSNFLLDLVIERAVITFPDSFFDAESVRVYFFVIVNKECLFEDNFTLQRQEGKLPTHEEFNGRRNMWNHAIRNLPFSFRSKVSCFVQAIGSKPEISSNNYWKTCLVQASLKRRCLRPSGNTAILPHSFLGDSVNTIKIDTKISLLSRCIPEERVEEIIREIR